jgi:NAD(P)H-dependent flavin oxidoreductase YrpB (nitropropane dioxygenase family)
MTLPTLLKDRLSLPVIGAPMFIVSGPELVLAQRIPGTECAARPSPR